MRSRQLQPQRRRHIVTAVLIALFLGLGTGCEKRLTIGQAPQINNAMHHNRPPVQRTGEPLELAIDYSDKKDDPVLANSKTYFAAKTDGLRLTDYPLHGQRFDGGSRELRVITSGNLFDFDLKITDEKGRVLVHQEHRKAALNSKVYIFAKFTDENGDVLPVPPAVFEKIESYESLAIEIGVDENRYDSDRTRGQYIRAGGVRK